MCAHVFDIGQVEHWLATHTRSGSFAFTGNAASLVYTPAGSASLTAAAGSFTATGQDAVLTYAGVLLASRARSAGRITETTARPVATPARRSAAPSPRRRG